MSNHLDRRAMLAVSAASLLAQPALAAPEAAPSEISGPMVGHTTTTSSQLWLRPGKAGSFVLKVEGSANSGTKTILAEANADEDFCVKWNVPGLSPATRYQYSITGPDGETYSDDQCYFTTSPEPTKPGKVCLAFGSCASNNPSKLWKQMEDQGAEALVLLGDTPYIDTTNLDVARAKHRQFLQVPELAAMIRHTPTWGTWDDHDFGRNDSDGRLKGKENTRKAFVEYRALREFGHDQSGIYTKFEYGPVDVFLLDTRWFARTEKSFADASKLTLLGKEQWKWLQESLLASTAPFKLLTCGMIWDDKENGESDDWGTYTHERDAVYQFIADNKIPGVVLIGGDIHCSRLLKYKTEQTIGYPMYQFIVSPIHDRVIPALNVPHPDLVRGEAIPHVWMRLEVDTTQSPAKLHAEWVQMDEQPMWDITLTADELTPA
ncbi:alkaline phosphatase D family protein [Bremerella sp. JC817]|uniref:alkaline phosphatase D family protein n=1 Tax=Bremerella sp. JC817 TaxID=3231756 RepID=UPI003457D33D